MKDWIDVASQLFLDYLKRDSVFNNIQLPINDKIEKISNLKASNDYKGNIKSLLDADGLADFMNELFNISPVLKNTWILNGNPVTDSSIITRLILTFIIDITQEQIQFIYSKSREDDLLRLRTKVSLGNFLSTFSYELMDVINLATNKKAKAPYITSIHNRLELYKMVHEILKKENIKCNELGIKKFKAPWIAEKDQQELILAPLDFEIPKNVNYLVQFKATKDKFEKLPNETDDDFKSRIMDFAVKAVDEKLQKIRMALEALTPANISTSSNPYQSQFVPWTSFHAIDVDLHYFKVTDSPPKMYIKIRDNFSIILTFAPDITRTLMELAKLQPLTKSKRIITEYDGSGELDIEKTVEMITKYGDFTLAQRESVRFREKDKARFTFIIDITQSMAQSLAKICGNCCMVKEFSDQSYDLNPDQSWAVKHGKDNNTNDCYFCGHHFHPSPSFRFAQFLFTIMIYIFKDFMSEALVGFIDYDFDKDINANAFCTFQDYEALLYYVWDAKTKISPRTNYYSLGRLYSDFPSFFDGFSKKFVFVITDGMAEDVFHEIFKIQNNGKTLYTDAFPYFKELASNKLINFIYCMITPSDKQSEMEHELGFRKYIKNDTFSHNYSETLLKLHVRKLLNTTDFQILLIDLKRLDALAKQYPGWAISQIRDKLGYGGAALTHLKYLEMFTSRLVDSSNNVIDYKLKEVPSIDSYKVIEGTSSYLIDIVVQATFFELVKKITHYDYNEKLIDTKQTPKGPEEYYLQTFQVNAKKTDVDASYHPSMNPVNRSSELKCADSIPNIFFELTYHLWLLENWDKVFVTDYFKLALTGELQRFVEIVKKRNLTDLRVNLRH